MRVTQLNLSEYRNYAEANLVFPPGPTLLLGKNGQGKTNIAEAICYFSRLSSHRIHGDQPLIRVGSDTAIIRMQIESNKRSILLELELNRGKANRAQLNKQKCRGRDIQQHVSTVLFAPEDLMVVKGDPALRRNLMDEWVIHESPHMVAVLSDYDRVVKQRNMLLKTARGLGRASDVLNTLDTWNERLIILGSEIVDARAAAVAQLTAPLDRAYVQLVQHHHGAHMHIVSSIPAGANEDQSTVERFRQALAEVREKELQRALTLVGPHRDDLFFGLNELPVRGYASHGETWSFALAIRLATAEHYRAHGMNGDPVLILDDVFAELDTERRIRLIEAIQGYEQIIVTAAVAADVPHIQQWNVVEIDSGSVVSAAIEAADE